MIRSIGVSDPCQIGPATADASHGRVRWPLRYHVGWDSSDDYIFEALTDTDLLDPRSESGASLRAAVTSLHDDPTAFAVLRNGPVPAHDVEAFFDVHRRGRAQLSAWLENGAGELLRSWLPG